MAVKILLNEIKVSIILSRLCQQLIERHKDFSNVVLVGLQPRGSSLLEELLKLLKEQGLKSIKSGKLDITFFRDDFRRNDEPLYAKTTEMSNTLEGKDVVLKKVMVDSKIKKNILDKEIIKTIYVENKVINLVVK